MKQFFKYVLATIVGILCVGAVISFFGIIMMGVMIAADSAKPSLKEGTVLRISLNGSINERAVDNPFADLLNSNVAKHKVSTTFLKPSKWQRPIKTSAASILKVAPCLPTMPLHKNCAVHCSTLNKAKSLFLLMAITTSKVPIT